MKHHTRLLMALAAALALFVAGCGSDSSESSTVNTSPSNTDTLAVSNLTGTITVSAAASLTEAFTQIGEDFTAANPGADVDFNFGSSSTLSKQIIDGAPADVYASADVANMTMLTDLGLIAGEPQAFAKNELVIVTKPGDPENIASLADLADAGVISLCGADVPCGKFAQQALDEAGVVIPESSVTRGQNVKATLTAVSQGDAVAGIVYVTDALVAGEAVAAVTIPAGQNVVVTYPIGIVVAAGNAEVARAFMDYVVSAEGQEVLARFGFLPPS